MAFFHDAKQIAFRVFDPHQPQVVVGHARDDLRLLVDRDVFGFGVRVQCVDVGSSEIDERAGSGAGMVRTLSGVEVKADAATIEEGHVRGGHQQRQAKGIAIKAMSRGRFLLR